MNEGGAPAARGRRSPSRRGFEPWRRPPGHFSGPLLANAEFRRRFLARLREMCETIFTEATMLPIIDALEIRLAPEVSVRADGKRENAQRAQAQFRSDIESFRRQVKNRRNFILSELDHE
jgi:hypothetical protein